MSDSHLSIDSLVSAHTLVTGVCALLLALLKREFNILEKRLDEIEKLKDTLNKLQNEFSHTKRDVEVANKSVSDIMDVKISNITIKNDHEFLKKTQETGTVRVDEIGKKVDKLSDKVSKNSETVQKLIRQVELSEEEDNE